MQVVLPGNFARDPDMQYPGEKMVTPQILIPYHLTLNPKLEYSGEDGNPSKLYTLTTEHTTPKPKNRTRVLGEKTGKPSKSLSFKPLTQHREHRTPTRDPNPETRNPETKTRIPKPEAQIPKHQTSNLKP